MHPRFKPRYSRAAPPGAGYRVNPQRYGVEEPEELGELLPLEVPLLPLEGEVSPVPLDVPEGYELEPVLGDSELPEELLPSVSIDSEPPIEAPGVIP